MKRYPLIDIAKLYCAVLVVLIHALEIPDGHYWGNLFKSSLSSQAVPFFFIASGFFFKKKWDEVQDKKQFTLGYAKLLLAFYMIWVLISSPEIIYQYASKYPDGSLFYIAALVFRRVFLAGYGVFWYLLVAAESSLIIGVLLVKKRKRFLYILAGVGLLLDLVYYTRTSLPGLEIINKVIYTIFSWNNNFLLKGLPFMSIGIYFADHCGRYPVKTRRLVIAYCAAFALHVAVFWGLDHIDVDPSRYTLLYPVQAILLFLIALSTDKIVLPDGVIRECRPLSSAIYCLHSFCIYYVINPIIGVNANTFLRTAVAVLLSTVIYWIVKKSNIKPLVRLITLK